MMKSEILFGLVSCLTALACASARFEESVPQGGTDPFERASYVPAERNGGRFSVHDYTFRGTGPKHVSNPLSDTLGCGSDIRCTWHLMWPEKGCGLNAQGLAQVRGDLKQTVFGRYFYETRERVPLATLDSAEAGYRARAFHLLGCAERMPERRPHFCSFWTFDVACELTWPFGTARTGGGAAYAQPVICFRDTGYENDNGCGCHHFVYTGVYSLPDGRRLDERDYFRADRLQALFDLVWERLLKDNGFTEKNVYYPEARKQYFRPGGLEMSVSRDGMTWWANAYTVFGGSFCVQHVTIPWSDLRPYLR